MTLETMEPNPVWVADAYGETVDTLAAHREALVFHVWGGDWCQDCRAQLPDFAAALDAAGVTDEQVHQYAVEKDGDGTKVGPRVEEYDVAYIPTVVVELADAEAAGDAFQADPGEELVRFVEEEPLPIAVYLADAIAELAGDDGPEAES